MSSRPRGRGYRGRGGGQWGGGQRGGYRGGGRGGRSDYYRDHPSPNNEDRPPRGPPRGSSRGPPPRGPPPRGPPPRGPPSRGMSPGPSRPSRGMSRSPPRQRDPEKLLASLDPESQIALTTAIINTVLKHSEDKDGRGSFREGREDGYRHSRERREGRGEYFREEMRPRRQYGESRRFEPRWDEEGRGHHYDREKYPSGSPRNRYGGNRYPGPPKRRPSPHSHPGPMHKRPRMERMDSDEGERMHHPESEAKEGEGHEGGERSRNRERRGSASEDERSRREGGTSGGSKGEGGPGGVQVTIRADGERAVNSDGHVRRVAGRLFVDLRCPHCPNQKSITFKEYKMHLVSDLHKSQFHRLARKHSVVLRKIRIQQRREQTEIEANWKEEKAEGFEKAISWFCSTCKLAFKCLGGNTSEGISLHNRSKLHRMQRHYLHPRCGICRITFPSRMVYEHHIASISHLRVRTATIDNQGGNRRREDDPEREDDEDGDLDLANFMTLDSVGEDDDEVGSEHEEITAGLDDVEGADKEEEDEDLEDSSSQRGESSSHMRGSRSSRYSQDQRDKSKSDRHRGPHDIPLEMDCEKEQREDDDDEDEGKKPYGTEYVTRIEAYYCSLCVKAIRSDSSLGSRAVQHHCRSENHLSLYWDQHPAPQQQDEDGQSGDDGEDDGDIEEDHEDKLWEEVDKGLTALQGVIMTEIEGEEDISGEDQNKEEKVNRDEENKERPDRLEDKTVRDDKDIEANVRHDIADKESKEHKEEQADIDRLGSLEKEPEEDWHEIGEELPDVE